ncbi:uncharacterized protein LOC130751465 [Actinidia eriantha]|uniref:uncharacterized protein LOC130751465 n=1 Tax=Actinidia eriantha TaxID=165200 RepID=UPI00258BE27F|nr:uncharacterized protein LOC130751465 [Actinidia eriantha]
MEAETERSRPSPSAKRNPLSDSTNFVIPTSTILRKLSSSLSNSPPFPNPIPKPKPNPNLKPKPKPYNSSAKKPETDSKSDTSIGSSNCYHNAPNPSFISQPHPSTPPRVSVTNSGSRNEDIFEPLIVYSRRQTAEKTKDKGKAVAVPFIFSSLQRKNNNENTEPVTSPPLQKEKDKGKAASLRFSCSLVDKTSNKRKAAAVPPSFSTLGKTKDKGKVVSVPISCPLLVNTRNKRKAIAVGSSCPPLPRTKKIRNKFYEAGDIGLSKSCTVPNLKNEKKRHCLKPEPGVSKHALAQQFVKEQIAYFKEVDDFELLEEEIYENELNEEEKSNKQDEVGAP